MLVVVNRWYVKADGKVYILAVKNYFTNELIPILPKFSQTECVLLIADKAKLGISGLDDSVKYLLLLSAYDGLVDYVTLVY